MKQFKDLNASIALLRALLAADDVEPEQKKEVERALGEVRKLRRKPQLTQADVFSCVRNVTESLVRAFLR